MSDDPYLVPDPMDAPPNLEGIKAMWKGAVALHDDIPITARRGRFRISEDMVKHHTDAARMVMAECVVVRCEYLFETMSFEYVAISPHFEDSRNYSAPEYEVLMERVNEGPDEGKITFKEFRKIES